MVGLQSLNTVVSLGCNYDDWNLKSLDMENEYQSIIEYPTKQTIPNGGDSHNRKKTNKHVTTKTKTYPRKSQPL